MQDADMSDPVEVQRISDYVTSSRAALSEEGDDMQLDKFMLQTQAVALEGNILYLVVDTNFILSQLPLVDQLKDLGMQYGLVIVVPLEVVRELDGLKNSTKYTSEASTKQTVGRLARAANDWIFSCLAQGVPTVKGQGATQKVNRHLTQDDAILDCAVHFQKEHTQTLVILLSNDKNLCLKALIQGILTILYTENTNAQVIAETVSAENIARFGVISPAMAVRQVEVPVAAHPEALTTACETIYSEVLMLVVSAVHKCMVQEYGDDLELVQNYDKRHVNTLFDAAHTICRFWVAVFTNYLRECQPFETQGTRKLPILTDKPTSADSLDEFLALWVTVLKALYRRVMSHAENEALGQIITRWLDMKPQPA